MHTCHMPHATQKRIHTQIHIADMQTAFSSNFRLPSTNRPGVALTSADRGAGAAAECGFWCCSTSTTRTHSTCKQERAAGTWWALTCTKTRRAGTTFPTPQCPRPSPQPTTLTAPQATLPPNPNPALLGKNHRDPTDIHAHEDKHVRARVGLLPRVSSLVGGHVPALAGPVVAEAALVGTLPRVRALVHTDLCQQGRRRFNKVSPPATGKHTHCHTGTNGTLRTAMRAHRASTSVHTHSHSYVHTTHTWSQVEHTTPTWV